MADTPQLPPKRFKTEDNPNSPTPAHMSHGQSYVTPGFPITYASGYSSTSQNPQQQQQQQQYYNQQTYASQSYVQPDHNYQALSHPLPSYHAGQATAGASRKRTASELDAPGMGQSVGGLAYSNYHPTASSGVLPTGHTASGPVGMVSSAMGIPNLNDPNLHLGAGHEVSHSPIGPRRGRTNTPWTREEEMRLKAMRDNGNSWSEIAREFPNRTEGSVKKHWYKDMHYTEISEDEGSFKTALLAAIKEYDANKWKIIGQKMGKPAKACEQFAREHLGKV